MFTAAWVVSSLRQAGHPVAGIQLSGLAAEDARDPPIMMAAGEIRVQASAVGTRQDLEEVLAMAAAGKLHCQVSTRRLDEVNTIMDEMKAGKIAGRVVLEM